MRNMRHARAVKHFRSCNNIILEHFLSACEKKAKCHINIKVQIQCNTQHAYNHDQANVMCTWINTEGLIITIFITTACQCLAGSNNNVCINFFNFSDNCWQNSQ